MDFNSSFQRVDHLIDRLRPDMIEFQKSITRIMAVDPSSGGEGEWDKVMFIKDFLKKIGINDIEQVNAPDPRAKNQQRPNLIAKIPGKSCDRTIWIMAHTDVVPAGELKLWQTDPFEVVEKDGKLFGRGTEDNQQSLTSAVFTAFAFLKADIKPTYDLALLLVADEETGSKYGLNYLLKHKTHRFRKDDIYIVPDAGESTGSKIEVAEKGIVWLKFVTKGKQCHASEPDLGINAFLAGSHLVVRLQDLYQEFNLKDDVFVPNKSTFEPTKKEGNVPNINTIPGEDVFYLDCRLLPTYTSTQLLQKIGEICNKTEKDFGVKIEYSTHQKEDAAPATPSNSAVVQMLQQAIKHVYKVEATPIGIGGGTVAAIFRRKGLDVAVWSTIDNVCHQPNEYCVIDNMVKDAKVFAHLCLQNI
jgi:succinyl-diaminopimelate desuccinylase